MAEAILDGALALAARSGWEAMRLGDLAEALGIALDEIRRHYPEKDALIDACFDRADSAALRSTDRRDAAARAAPPRQRLFEVIMAWLDALEPHRPVVRQMMVAKAELGHLHIQIPAVIRISRTVQWLREAAGLHDRGVRRALAESVTSGIYLAAFARWLAEQQPGSPSTRRDLARMLAGAQWLAQLCLAWPHWKAYRGDPQDRASSPSDMTPKDRSSRTGCRAAARE